MLSDKNDQQERKGEFRLNISLTMGGWRFILISWFIKSYIESNDYEWYEWSLNLGVVDWYSLTDNRKWARFELVHMGFTEAWQYCSVCTFRWATTLKYFWLGFLYWAVGGKYPTETWQWSLAFIPQCDVRKEHVS